MRFLLSRRPQRFAHPKINECDDLRTVTLLNVDG